MNDTEHAVPDAVGVPVRYRIAPLFALVALALVPLAALTALLVWSDAQADDHERSTDERTDTFVPTVAAGPALTTSMFDFRRTPNTLVQLATERELATAMEQLAAFIDPRSCLAVSVNGRLVSSWNGDIAVIPASTNKLLVGGTAIEVLGPEYRFTTSLAAMPSIDGVVDGDLVLVGGGDPLLVTADFEDDDGDAPDAAATTQLERLADAVVAAGITSIRGSVVGDGSRYDDEFVNPAWADGVALIEAGPIGALLVNDGQTIGRSGRQSDPHEAAARELWRLLGDRGVAVSNGFGTGVLDPALPVLATVESAPLSAIVADMLIRSDNDTAEMLVKELGHATTAAGTTDAGLAVVEDTVGGWGAPLEGVVFSDGSGLSAQNRLTCDTLVAVLDQLRATPTAEGLPVAGRSGTLIDEFLGTAVEGRLIAKTGTLTNPPADADPPEVKALAGYLDAPNGDVLAFALVLNGPGYVSADGYVPFWEALAERLAAHPVGPDVAALAPR